MSEEISIERLPFVFVGGAVLHPSGDPKNPIVDTEWLA
jgi:hypothetical protein